VTYAFTRAVARTEVVAGVLIIFTGAVLAIVAFLISPQHPGWSSLPPREELVVRALIAAGLFAAGVSIGTWFIVVGQLVLVFLDIRARLARIDRRLGEWETSRERESPVTERLRPR